MQEYKRSICPPNRIEESQIDPTYDYFDEKNTILKCALFIQVKNDSYCDLMR